jgi:hypothetical protein
VKISSGWIFVFLTLLLSIIPVVWVWKTRAVGWADWLATLLASGAFVVLMALAAPWVFLSYYLRWGLPALFILALVRSYYRSIKGVPFGVRNWRVGLGKMVLKIGLLLPALYLNAMVLQGYFYPGEPINLSFPLKDGVYSVIQGGNSRITNFFHRFWPSQRYALDIVQLNPFGNRAAGIAPKEASRYEIFGETLYSPCSGTVIASVDGFPDNRPGQMDEENSAGNHVEIRCKGVKVLLAHLMNGSLKVRYEDSVEEGQVLGRVGNSGYTVEPHLHISAETDRKEGVPMTFSGRFLSINSLIFAKK